MKKGYALHQTFLLVREIEEALTLRLQQLVALDLRLVSARDGRPVPDAVIFFNPGIPQEGASERLPTNLHGIVLNSDTNGLASVEVYPGGDGSYHIIADDYVTLSRQVRFPEDPGEELAIELVPATKLAGVVRGPAGHPLPEVEVQLNDARGPVVPRDVTDSAGEFTLEGLPPGPVTLRLRSPGFDLQRREVEVHPGSQNRVDLVLKEPLRVRISGQVSTAELGRPPWVMRIEAHDKQALQSYTTTTNANGDFVFVDLPASRYKFSALVERFYIAADDLDVQADVTDLALVARWPDVPGESE